MAQSNALAAVQAAAVGSVAVWGGWCAAVKRELCSGDTRTQWRSGIGVGWPEEHIAAQPDLAIIPPDALAQFRPDDAAIPADKVAQMDFTHRADPAPVQDAQSEVGDE